MNVTKEDWRTALSEKDFRLLVQAAFGKGGQSRFAKFSGISRAQVNRYANGGKIPRHVAVLLLLAVAAKDAGYSLSRFATGNAKGGPADANHEREVRGAGR